MNTWKQKLQLAESISNKKFTDGQTNVFLEDQRDLSFFVFDKQEEQTTVGVAYALVNAYWNPSSKYLYMANDSIAVSNSKTIAEKMAKNFEKYRPERTYETTYGNACISFGDVKSEIHFRTLGTYHQIENDYSAVILDTHYKDIKLAHIINIIGLSNKLMIMSKMGYKTTLSTTQNKLDAIVDDIALHYD